ncbi:MAG: 2OG-Fe(II) oxygenase [Novosphingobium sp.]
MTASPAPKCLIIDPFLGDDLHDALLAFALGEQDAFKPTTIRRGKDGVEDQAVRQSLRRQGGLGPFEGPFTAAVHARLPELCRALGVSPFEIAKTELELAAHGDGGFYKVHLDTFTQDARLAADTDRAISAVYYFHRQPKGFVGGDLQMHRFGGGLAERIEPADNRLAAFASIAPHEVLPIKCPSGRFEDYRFAVNCWLHRSRD